MSNTWLSRYLHGEHEAVIREMEQLQARSDFRQFPVETNAVLQELMRRVQRNLETIHASLLEVGHQFHHSPQISSDLPLLPPFPNTESLLFQLDRLVEPYGKIPLSLRAFYQHVGGCNFAWGFSELGTPLWRLADPIQIIALDDLVDVVASDTANGEFQFQLEELGHVSLPLSADAHHKDDESGGAMYTYELTSGVSLDSNFDMGDAKIPFITYLRTAIQMAGMPNIAAHNPLSSYDAFLTSTQAKLIPF